MNGQRRLLVAVHEARPDRHDCQVVMAHIAAALGEVLGRLLIVLPVPAQRLVLEQFYARMAEVPGAPITSASITVTVVPDQKEPVH